MKRSSVKFHLIKICLLTLTILTSFFVAYPQDAQSEKEIDFAIENVMNGNFEQAMPVLKKYADVKGFDDYNTLRINVYLNFCYLATESKALNVEQVNNLTDAYLAKYGISKTDSTKSKNEITSYYFAASINSYSGNIEKGLLYLKLITNYYEENQISYDQFYLGLLNNISQGYLKLENYENANEFGQKAWKVNSELFGEKNETSLKILDILYSCYKNVDDEKCLEYVLKYVEISRELFGEKSTIYISSLVNVYLLYSKLGIPQKALEINMKVVELEEEVLGEKHPDYLTSLSYLGLTYYNLGDYQKALEIFQKVVELGKEVLGEKHQGYLTGLDNLSSGYLKLGDYQKALVINLKVGELRKELVGEKHPDYLISLSNLALIYSGLGEYPKALETNLKVVELNKEVLGEIHPYYITSLGNLAKSYSELGDYKKALEINLEVVELYKEVLGEKHPDYLKSLNNLAQFYSLQGEYKNALEINLQVIEKGKELLGEKHPNYLMSLNNLALVYYNLGDYQKAWEINQKVAELRKEILGVDHPDYLMSLNNLAMSCSALGDYQKALEISLKVVEIGRVVLGDKHPGYLTYLKNLALLYSELNDYQKALEIDLNVVELKKQVLGEKHPSYIASLNSLASDYSEIGDYQKALEIFLKVVELGKEVLGEKHPDYLTSMSNLAYGYSNLGNNQKALELYLKVSELCKEVLGEKHPDYIWGLNDLAMTEFQLSETNSALFHKRIVTQETQKRMIDNFSLLTENQRELFWKRFRNLFLFSTLIVENTYLQNPESVCYVYDLSLFSKGLLLNTTLDFNQIIVEKGTPEAIAKFEELKLLKLQIQRLQEKPIAERYFNVDSLENIAQQKETELVKLSKEYGDYTSNLKITWKDVQSNLQDNDVAIEFVAYPTLTDTVKYAALVVRKDWQYPKMIPLYRKDQIEELIKQDKNKIYSNSYVGKQIKKLIWEPLEEVVAFGERVYFSPAGIIHQLAIENLPLDDSTTLGDHYQMFRLSSTKELVLHQPESPNATAVLYGGLKYDLEVKELVAESDKYEFEKSSSYLTMRGYSADSTFRSGWKFLGGTLAEVEQINGLLSGKNYQVTKYTGNSGNEESFKSLSGKGKDIIHIATHGFFLPIEESRKNQFMQMRMGDQQETGQGVDPMLRSGLMLSGGNRAWQGEKIPDNIEDGVLTAREISRMDLRGTDLVVLSACETGLGEVSSEGVFGLQRSFKQAGVQSLLMSLWEVSDETTRYMMTEFYAGLLSGKEKRVAFLEAKQKCKEKFPEPQYWAAFIMLD